MNNVADLEDLIYTAQQIKAQIEAHEKTARHPKCDKHDIGFNNDCRFSSASVTVKVTAYTGFYGDSSCGTTSIVKNEKIFKNAFLKVLNRHFKKLMFETSDEIMESAVDEKEKAIEELNGKLEKFKALGEPTESSAE